VTEILLNAFITLFVVIDPLGIVPIFVALTKEGSAAYRRRMAVRAALVASGVLLVFALGGKFLLDRLGIGLPAFRVAGGVMLFLIALEMVFEKRAQRRSHSAEEAMKHGDDTTDSGPAQTHVPDDVSVFPLAVPLMAGPGAIASVMLLMSKAHGDVLTQGALIGVLLLVMVLCLIGFLLSEYLQRIMNETVTNIISRLLGMLLAALAIQYVFDGLRAEILTG